MCIRDSASPAFEMRPLAAACSSDKHGGLVPWLHYKAVALPDGSRSKTPQGKYCGGVLQRVPHSRRAGCAK
eukprot:9962034-Alexandrium_andersonii.AAC.1